jgi:SM-20-related protein
MVKADFLARLGLFVINNFFDLDTCAELRSKGLAAQGKPATVTEGSKNFLDPDYRKTIQISMDPNVEQQVHSKILAIQPKLEEHFQVKLTGCTPPLFLSYSVGDYFRLHRDTVDNSDLPESIQKRQVSVSILLNNAEEQDTPLTYSGGALTFYDLLKDPRLKQRGFPLQGEEGMLIAFSSRVLHEVQPVTRGQRYSIVTWFV